MDKQEKARNKLAIDRLSCCGTKPKALRHIKLTKNEYCPYPFECLFCGAILEVARMWNAHHCYSGGCNQYGRSYTSYSEHFYFTTIENHPAVRGTHAYWEEAFWKLVAEEVKVDKASDRKIGRISHITGGLDKAQRDRTYERLCQDEIRQIKDIKERKRDLDRQIILRVRAALGMPERVVRQSV